MNEQSGAVNLGGREPQERNTGSESRFGRRFDHHRVIGLYVACCVALAAIAAALLISSCGGSKTESSSALMESSSPPVGSESATPVTAMLASMPVAPASTPMATTPNSGEALPPEIAIGEMETAVHPGQPVSFAVYGTPDVAEMSLWDGLNDRQAFVHDASGDVWRVDYRVPLRPRHEPIALSVTAKNESGRWRRVWVFLHTKSEAPAAEVQADSLSGR